MWRQLAGTARALAILLARAVQALDGMMLPARSWRRFEPLP
ncbi:MAG TPA: hypothetical protein VE684_06575 [Crenalkalicoccus sp.]|nr:hypothetical protein [Crenalkalicoccus sp.]